MGGIGLAIFLYEIWYLAERQIQIRKQLYYNSWTIALCIVDKMDVQGHSDSYVEISDVTIPIVVSQTLITEFITQHNG